MHISPHGFLSVEIALTGADNESQYGFVICRVAPEARGAPFSSRIRTAAGVLRLAYVVLLACLIPSSYVSASDAELLPAQGSKPAFTLSDPDGAEVALATHRGRAVIVHFFATWCEPCREELPALRRLVERARDRKLSVVAISVAEVPVRVRRFMEQMQVNFPVLLDQDRRVAKAWDVSALPSTFILDAELKPRLAIEREYDWDRLDVATLLENISREGRP